MIETWQLVVWRGADPKADFSSRSNRPFRLWKLARISADQGFPLADLTPSVTPAATNSSLLLAAQSFQFTARFDEIRLETQCGFKVRNRISRSTGFDEKARVIEMRAGAWPQT
jgi:hypothetical protein